MRAKKTYLISPKRAIEPCHAVPQLPHLRIEISTPHAARSGQFRNTYHPCLELAIMGGKYSLLDLACGCKSYSSTQPPTAYLLCALLVCILTLRCAAVASCLNSIVSAIAGLLHTIFSAIGSILHTM